ncbi:hypothetical protein F0L74_12610 [Chitinophaga agrisoli]|uniref:Uncharacterized protein n=1 Tax=Chitinophaga agrisoli TaxID=2607653 RepID=A0A5B2VXL0_9BACT|nr:hypothetical protein [Chitinophaga agrisoli]KAA2243340.1 hypothetical protein F0L74_12610 [Chitinophaga agrisoli]
MFQNKNSCLYGLVLLISLFSCRQQAGNTEFEGIITYKIIYKDYTLGDYGDTLKVFYSKGNMIRAYNTKDPKGLRKEIFLAKGPRYFMNIGPSDTLYSYDITSNNLVLTDTKKLQSKKILNYTCERFDMYATLTTKSGAPVFTAQSTTFSRDALKVNPLHFKNWRFGNFNIYVEHAGSLPLRSESTTKYSDKTSMGTKIYEAVAIAPQQLDPKMFEIDESMVREFVMPQ